MTKSEAKWYFVMPAKSGIQAIAYVEVKTVFPPARE
jgi:hypothetical protein